MSSQLRRFLFLLSIWQERPESAGSSAVWRYRLENARGGKHRGFASLDALTAYLVAQMELPDEIPVNKSSCPFDQNEGENP